MADVTYRANLSAVSIPLISEEFGRTIIVKQQDQNFVPTVVSKSDQDKDIGIPQAYYGHNIVPTNYGYKSVGYALQIPGIAGVDDFHMVIPFFDSTGDKRYLGITEAGVLYTASSLEGAWSLLPNIFSKAVLTADPTNTGNGTVNSMQVLAGAVPKVYDIAMTSATAYTVKIGGTLEATGTVGTLYTSADGLTSFTVIAGSTAFAVADAFSLATTPATFTGAISYATVSGNTYMCVAGVGIFAYSYAEDTLYTVVPAGIDVDALLGVTSAGGYLVVYADTAVAWCSLLDVMDFIPSLTTGAGGGSVEGARGAIRKLVGVAGGFIVFTSSNAVGAAISGNSRYPFVFKEISNCGGLTDLTLCTEEADAAAVYAFTTNGLQQVTLQKASTTAPEITDFLSGMHFEDFDVNTISFIRQRLSSPLKKQLAYIAGRYLLLSYGINDLTHAIYYDTALQRYGRLRVDHRIVISYGFLDADSADSPKKQVGFLLRDGTLKLLDFSINAYVDDSVLILGKFQYVRSRRLQLDGVDVETVDSDADFTLLDLPSPNGKSYGNPVAGYLAENVDGLRSYNFRTTALNHSLVCLGAFRLSSVILNFNVHGAR